MAISLVKKPAATVQPWRAALDANLRAIVAARVKLAPISAKDRAAEADITEATEAEQRVTALRGEIDQLTADARYAGGPAPDLSGKNRALSEAETALKQAAAKARAAAVVRQRYAADTALVHEEVRGHTRETNRLLWEAVKDELAGLAIEYEETEARFLDVLRRVFAAATAADKIAMQSGFNPDCASANIGILRIGRPEHPAFVDPTLTPEQAHARRIEYLRSIDAAADALVGRLLTHA